MSEGTLTGVKVLDLTDERAIYGAKLLADLGADVVRPEPPDGDPLRQRGPFHSQAETDVASLYYAFFGSSRRSVTLDLQQDQGRRQLRQLAGAADIVLLCEGGFGTAHLDLGQLRQQHPKLVVIETNSLGKTGPWRDYAAPDFVAGALGGAVATTGDVDTPPLKAFGELNFMVSGAYVGIAALAALYSAGRDGEGESASVSVHECIASCLEQVLMFYWYADVMQRPEGAVLPRRGSTHWSNAFTVMNGQDGSIMITPTPDFDRQLAWLIEEDAHGDLIDPKYAEPENLALLIGRTMELLGEWVSSKEVEALFYDGQARHMPYGWVQPLARIGDNPQLQARNWFTEIALGNASVNSTGAPYRFSDSSWSMSGQQAAGMDTQAVLDDIGWGGSA